VRNVVVGCSYFNFGSGRNPGPFLERSNTFQEPTVVYPTALKRLSDTDLVFKADGPDPRFCDPAHLDYRLQADSPFRGRAPGGKDPGAFPFAGDVFFVSPDGADTNDGLSVARAWRTLRHACAAARPGDTIYLLPGRYVGPLSPARSGTEQKPIVFRARGAVAGAAVVVAPKEEPACDLDGRSFVTVEDLAFRGGAAGVRIAGSRGIRLTRCTAEAAAGPGLLLQAADDVDARFCRAVGGAGSPAVALTGRNTNVSLTSSLLECARGPALRLGATPVAELFLEYNDYAVAGGALIEAGGRAYARLEAWGKASRLDRYSLAADPRIADAEKGLIAPDSPLIGAGQFGRCIGPLRVAREAAAERITEVRLREVTPTTASFTWWTPDTSSALRRPTGGWWQGPTRLARLTYGRTPACGEGAVDSFGDVYHRVTLFDLRPGTSYFYRVELTAKPVRTPVARFVTPSVAAWRPARRTLYVAPDGDDAADGLSRATAWRTLMKASEEARAGDTVLLGDGVYKETLAPVATGVAGAPITFRAEHLNRAVLDGSNFHRPTAVYVAQKGHIVVDGLVMRRFAPKNLGRRAGMDYAQVVLWEARRFTMKNCVQWGYGNYGLGGIALDARGVTLANNVMMGFVAAWAGRRNRDVRIVHNTFYVPTITNLRLEGAPIVLRNNLFFGKRQQKYRCANYLVPKGSDVDYNAYVFHADDPCRYISGQGLQIPAGAEGLGLAAWRALSGGDAHGLELPVERLRFARATTLSTGDRRWRQFWAACYAGERVPTLADLALPAGHPLDTAGENRTPIGARPPR